jgi:uncharacterized protein (DUF2384 family)
VSERTAGECVLMLAQSYRSEGIAIVLRASIGALGGQRPIDLMDTAEGRERVYDWALGLAEGVMG